MKACNTCLQDLPLSEFYIYGYKASGEVSYTASCKSCRNSNKRRNTLTYVRESEYRERNSRFIDAAKDRPCADCGIKYPTYVMDFDHKSNKRFNISNLRFSNVSLATIQEEINKCDVVCANCHRIRTHNRA